MARVEKTVFISYRRTNFWTALAIYQYLTQHGFDVFIDYQGIAAGDFETSILENVRGRAHFLVILTPSALERLDEPGDWLRREIETAIECRRNIVPLMFDRFDFDSATATKQLTGTLANLPRYNGLTVPNEYFFEAMERLRTKHLNVALEAVPQPPSAAAQRAAETQSAAAKAAPIVEEVALSAEQWFERGVRATDRQDKLRAYSEAIRLQPEYAEAYYNRGIARRALGDLPRAITDYDAAIRLRPHADPYNNRGIVRRALGDLAGAISDYDAAIRLQPEYAEVVYNNRGIARKALGDSAGAIADYDAAIRLQPEYAQAYNNRGVARSALWAIWPAPSPIMTPPFASGPTSPMPTTIAVSPGVLWAICPARSPIATQPFASSPTSRRRTTIGASSGVLWAIWPARSPIMTPPFASSRSTRRWYTTIAVSPGRLWAIRPAPSPITTPPFASSRTPMRTTIARSPGVF